MISEVVPGPKSMLFFALFNCVGKTSGFIGPFISSAIIKADGGNNHTAYWFMLGTALIGIAILWFVDPDQAKIDSAKCKFKNVFWVSFAALADWNMLTIVV
jgi:MFS-type transporter involved in bile tolerance (Atg22 family)